MTKGSKKPNPLPSTTVHVKLPQELIDRLTAMAHSQHPPCSVNALLRFAVSEYLKGQP